MRLEKYLIQCGIDSGKKIKKLIKNGEIRVNGIIELDIGKQIDENIDKITYLNEILKEKKLKYYVMYKPAGYLTAMSNPVNDKPTVADILPEWLDKRGIAPVGRLDKDTEGVLIFTNDGNLNYELTYPDKQIDKEYYAELERIISDSDIHKLENKIIIDNYQCKPSKAKKITNNSITLTIVEGRYHQVKKMLKAVNNRVTYLKRIRFAKITLDNMNLGEFKEIKKEDII
ncbi:MAG: pseudouridine synthase [Fusobacteriaceae bacterium]